MSRTVLALASLVAMLGAGGCGGGAKNGTGALRAACYPPCLANLVARCPLVGACVANLETDNGVALPGESGGVATCFSTGERERTATNFVGYEAVYVKAPDGSECYAAIGDQRPGVETWNLSVGGELFGELTWNLSTGAVAVTCDAATTQIDTTKTVCQGVPWQNATSCTPGRPCTFGEIPAPGFWDAGAPCDPTLCTTPPATECQVDSVTLRYSVASYDGTPTCTNIDGCLYPKAVTPCDHGCYLAQCTAMLASITNVQGKAAVRGVAMPVSLTGGGVAANSVVTVTARTSPRGAASAVSFRWDTCTASTLCVLTDLLFMDLDPSTPAGQTDYDQWTVDVPGQTAGTRVEFQLQATGAGDGSSMISQASLGVPWSYTSN